MKKYFNPLVGIPLIGETVNSIENTYEVTREFSATIKSIDLEKNIIEFESVGRFFADNGKMFGKSSLSEFEIL